MIIRGNRLKNLQSTKKMRKPIKSESFRRILKKTHRHKTSSRLEVIAMMGYQASRLSKMPLMKATYQFRTWNRNLISLNS